MIRLWKNIIFQYYYVSFHFCHIPKMKCSMKLWKRMKNRKQISLKHCKLILTLQKKQNSNYVIENFFIQTVSLKVFRYHSMKGSGNIFLLCMEILIKSFERKPKMHLKKNVALLKLNYLLIDRDHHQQNHFFIVLSCCFPRAQKSAAKIYRFSFFSLTLISFWYHISYWRMHHNL